MHLGIDLAFPGKPVACAILARDASLQLITVLRTDEDILSLAASLRPDVVAIDAPLSLPAGWACLYNPCSCGGCRTPDDTRRSAEAGLAARGIGVYWTSRRSFIKPMIERGIALKGQLDGLGLKVIEVYPYATRRLLFGKDQRKKQRLAGRRWLQERLATRLPGLAEIGRLLTHDELDALVAAYTAYLFAAGRAEALGEEEDGFIYIPAIFAP